LPSAVLSLPDCTVQFGAGGVMRMSDCGHLRGTRGWQAGHALARSTTQQQKEHSTDWIKTQRKEERDEGRDGRRRMEGGMGRGKKEGGKEEEGERDLTSDTESRTFGASDDDDDALAI
jgi:hypothetical protein